LNFELDGSDHGGLLLAPRWGLEGEVTREMLPDLDTAIDRLIVLGENVLIRLFYKLKRNFPLEIQEIPVEKRGPTCPKRLVVGLAV
jgi:hypothetical protein